MKKIERALVAFMALSEAERNAIFNASYSETLSMESRAKLFMNMPITEAVRLMELIDNLEMDSFLFDYINRLPKGKEFIFSFLPNLSIPRLADLSVTDINSWFNHGHKEEFFTLLPMETVVKVIDFWMPDANHESFMKLKFLSYAGDNRILDVLSRIKPDSFANLMQERSLEEERKKIQRLVPKIKSAKQIAAFCEKVSAVTAVGIIINVNDDSTKKKVIEMVSQKIKNALFNSTKAKNVVLKSSDIDVVTLSLDAKKKFFKKYPKSVQLKKLGTLEQVEVLCA